MPQYEKTEIEMNALIQSIQVGRKSLYRADDGTTWESAIGKSTIAGSVAVHCEGLEGDEQADRIHHGGPDKAILVYSSEHFVAWRQEFPDWSVVGGTFGENFTVDGLVESTVCIGDVYCVGTCRLQVSQPRQLCWKLSKKWDLPKLAVIVQQTGRTGWYLRVIETGQVKAGDQFTLIDRPHPSISVAQAHQVMHAKPRSSEDDLTLSQCDSLSASWREQLERRAVKKESRSESARLFGSDI
jgi:MOSC domain-containing protein YiiM